MASGVEEERVRGEEEEDDRPQLSAAAVEALPEFLQEQRRDGGEEGSGGVELVAEDWRLSQFWYDECTARELAEEVVRLISLFGPASSSTTAAVVACVVCPTLYAYLKTSNPKGIGDSGGVWGTVGSGAAEEATGRGGGSKTAYR
uniref:Uncharacterized protein n=1 Tax=Oryza glumipatula TaxID=40148 RepID=A0A0D9ZIF3_9ORYZ